MQDRPVDPREIQSPIKLVCRNCGAVNTAKAYCCITCFKVLRPKPKLSFWQIAMKPSVSIAIFFTLMVVAGLFAMKKWIDKIEGRFRMEVKTADYNISVVAGKKKSLLGRGEKKANEFTDIDAAESGQSSLPTEAAPPVSETKN